MGPSARRAAPIFREYKTDGAAERTLLRWVQRALHGVLASSLLVATTSADDSGPRRTPSNGASASQPGCLHFEHTVLGIRPAVAFDYLSLRVVSAQPGSTSSVRVLSETGEPCDNAPDAKCLERLDSGRYGKPFESGPWFVATKGGRVRIFAFSEMRDLFGAIDTPVEALWLVDAAGYSSVMSCADDNAAGRRNYIVRARREERAANVIRVADYVLEVRANGTLNTVAQKPWPPGNKHLDISDLIIEGRRPAGLVPRLPNIAVTPGEHFARAAREEAESIAAFLQLEGELARAGAPHRLVLGARRAAREELGHAHAMGVLAHRFGGAPEPTVVRPTRPRNLFALALDNTVEGCVHETFSAIRISYEALRARDPAVRSVLADIARDEIRHAAWSWEFAAWAEPRLRAPEREAVVLARREAMQRLYEMTPEAPSPQVCSEAGVPDAATARGLAAALLDAVQS